MTQVLDPGMAEERNPVNDFYSLPLTPMARPDGSEMTVSVTLAGAQVILKFGGSMWAA